MRRAGGIASCLLLVAAPMFVAVELAAAQSDPLDDAARVGFAASLVGNGRKVTQHTVTIRGQRVEYTATVSGTVLRDSSQQPSAIFVAMSYARRDVVDPVRRPVTFAWNGGPSGASTGLHFGVLGPRIRAVDDSGRATTPMRLVDNAHSILDRTDLVMVDPMATGLTVPLGRNRIQDFYSIRTDAASVAQFIVRWLEENGRTQSPVYLLGESYGTVRMPVVAPMLQSRGVPLAGLIFIASAADGNTIWEASGHLNPYYFYLPSYAAIAFYHRRLPRAPRDLQTLWREAGQFALGEYATALLAWPKVTPAQKSSVLDKLHRYTGISREVWERNNIRLGTVEFSREILRDQGRTISLSDARQTSPAQPSGGGGPVGGRSGGPGGGGAGATAESYVDAYLRTELGVTGAPVYRPMAPGTSVWNWFDHGLRQRAPVIPGYQNFLDDVALAMKNNPRLRVQQHSGIFDLQCNAFPADWAMERMSIPEELRRNVSLHDYESGHAVFSNSPGEFLNFTRNLVAFYDAAGDPRQASGRNP